MPLDTIFTGAVDANFNTPGNWSHGVPADGQSWGHLDGSRPILEGLDQTAKTFSRVEKGSLVRAAWGVDQFDPLRFNATELLIAAGDTYVSGSMGRSHITGGNGPHIATFSDSTLGEVHCYGGSGTVNLVQSGGPITTSADRLTITSPGDLLRVECICDNIAEILAGAGTVVIGCAANDVVLFGSASAIGQGLGTNVLNLDIVGEARYVHRDNNLGRVAVAGTNGRFDGSQSTQRLGHTINILEAYRGGTANLRSASGAWTVSSTVEAGGVILRQP